MSYIDPMLQQKLMDALRKNTMGSGMAGGYKSGGELVGGKVKRKQKGMDCPKGYSVVNQVTGRVYKDNAKNRALGIVGKEILRPSCDNSRGKNIPSSKCIPWRAFFAAAASGASAVADQELGITGSDSDRTDKRRSANFESKKEGKKPEWSEARKKALKMLLKDAGECYAKQSDEVRDKLCQFVSEGKSYSAIGKSLGKTKCLKNKFEEYFK